MKVKELIERLQQCSPDATVFIESSTGEYEPQDIVFISTNGFTYYWNPVKVEGVVLSNVER